MTFEPYRIARLHYMHASSHRREYDYGIRESVATDTNFSHFRIAGYFWRRLRVMPNYKLVFHNTVCLMLSQVQTVSQKLFSLIKQLSLRHVLREMFV